MSKPLANWWRSHQFRAAIKQDDTQLAERILQKIQSSGAGLSWTQKLFRDNLQYIQSAQRDRRGVTTLNGELRQASQRIAELEQKLKSYQPVNSILQPNEEIVKYISNSFKLIKHDEYKLQCTGIEKRVFDDFEARLAEYLKCELEKIPVKRLKINLQDANEDINKLKVGQDPRYNFELTPYVYFMRYFLENVYGACLAWFLVYQSGLLPHKLNVLDIAAGPGTIAYGLALLLQSHSSFGVNPIHISYYSLEQQASLQYRGLQFWRRYIESQRAATNAYFRFDTANFFDYQDQVNKLPKNFFDFVVISHCFFCDSEQRSKSYKIYKRFFINCLKSTGCVLLIIQGKKLFKAYNLRQTEDHNQENQVVKRFVKDLGLSLEWYKYITSTGKRTSIGSAEFAKFAEENLPVQEHMVKLKQQYLGIKHGSRYALDDYVILAKIESSSLD